MRIVFLIFSRVLLLLHGSKNAVYIFHRLKRETQISLSYTGKTIDSADGPKLKIDPGPYGLSGCGLWLVKPASTNGTAAIDYRLVGILTQFRKSKFQVLVGNCIDINLDALRNYEGINIIIRSTK